MIRETNTRAARPEIDPYFYRKHTHGMLRRYLYCAMQTSRVASSLRDPLGRGWVSSRPIRTFEDAIIFVHDMDKCLQSLPSLDRDMLRRHVLQEYTQPEAAVLLGMSPRTFNYKFPKALDLLTEKLFEAELLILPQEAL